MGGQNDANDFHKTVFDEERLRHMMMSAGLTDIKKWSAIYQDCSSHLCSLNLQGIKTSGGNEIAKPFPKHRKIVAIMSMPRLTFSDNMFCAVQTLVAHNIPFEKVTGAYWGQCLERLMESHEMDGTEWLLTLDYDTLFSPEHFHRLAVLMEENPHIDAIAPLQAKRDDDGFLSQFCDEKGDVLLGAVSLDHFEQPIVRANWAHFGLTLIRMSALKKMEHPWFLGVPNADGRWGECRIDDDIYFWDKFKKAGNKLGIATFCVGHLELRPTWLDKEFNTFTTRTKDFYEKGAPSASRQ
jgi:hypothetical protein